MQDTRTPSSRPTSASTARRALAARPRNAEVGGPMSTPVLRQQCPALVVAPAASNLEVSSRESFATKSQATNKGARRVVARLDVCLYAMEVQLSERPAQRQREPLGHVPTSRMRNKRIVAEIGAPKSAVNDLVDVDHAHELAGCSQDDETSIVRGLLKTAEILAIRLRRAGRRRPPPKENPAASSSV